MSFQALHALAKFDLRIGKVQRRGFTGRFLGLGSGAEGAGAGWGLAASSAEAFRLVAARSASSSRPADGDF